jgi:hypothetical protein
MVTGIVFACGKMKRMPGRHRVRVREDEADAGQPGQIQFAHHRHEVVAVRAQAVHPDDGDVRVVVGLDLDVFEQVAHADSLGRCADFGRKALQTAGSVSA